MLIHSTATALQQHTYAVSFVCIVHFICYSDFHEFLLYLYCYACLGLLHVHGAIIIIIIVIMDECYYMYINGNSGCYMQIELHSNQRQHTLSFKTLHLHIHKIPFPKLNTGTPGAVTDMNQIHKFWTNIQI